MKVVVGIIGPGLVGNSLIQQITKQIGFLKQRLNADVSIVGVSNSKLMLVDPKSISADGWKAELQAKGSPRDLRQFGKLIKDAPADCRIMVDCTASEEPPSLYLEYAQQGLHIVTPNKKFGAGPLDRFRALQPISSSLFMCEATVGAGLPVISTLRSLIETGDRVLRIEGVLSGTLSYIFNTYKPGMRFSDVVADAKAKGYTEPDPRDDLSGTDVARKVVILARECGLDVELSDLRVESLVPEPLAKLASSDEYMQRLGEHDGEVGSLAETARAEGKVVRYIGRVDMEAKACSVELTSVPESHPFAQLSGSDNLVVFTTERYRDRPLCVRGPGAGTEVTAAGIFSDVIQVIRSHAHVTRA